MAQRPDNFVMYTPRNSYYHVDMKCVECDVEFQPKRLGAPPKFCSARCKERARHRRDREKRNSKSRAYYPSYYKRNREEIRQANKKWIEAHPDKPRQYTATYRERHPEVRERERRKAKEYLQKNRDKILAQKREHHKANRQKEMEYQASHRDRLNEYARKWQAKNRAKNPELHRQRQNEWYRRNPAKYLAKNHRRTTRVTGAGGSYTAEQWNDLVARFGHRCLCCGKTGVKLTVDHVIPVIMGGTSNIDNLQPLCLPCNSKKHTKIVDYRGNHAPTP